MVARKRFFRFSFLVFIFTMSLAVTGLLLAQDPAPIPRAEITGVDPSALPTVVTSVNVYDTLGQPVSGLTAADFRVIDALEGVATVTSVENISSDNLPFSTVLVIDVSSSMFDYPINQARAAARAFVDGIRPIDSVAIVTFGNSIDIVQPFTTDKTTLYNAIDSIVAYGQTGLYQGAYDAIALAGIAPNARRAVIVLSDGAEYGGVSLVGRTAARELAIQTGVPVYTIGVGYGFDRTYLQDLSGSTNARFYESPTAVELTDIFGNLARLLSSQYVVTMNVDVPADGTEYPLVLRVQTPEGEAITPAGVLRAPIPIPLVDFAPLTDSTIAEPTTITANIRADQPITGVVFGVLNASGAGVMAQNDAEAPYEVTIDPVSFFPGDYTVTALATDEDGDIGGGNLAISVAALPSTVAFDPIPGDVDPLSEPLLVGLAIGGQTDPTNVQATVGGTTTTLTQPYEILLDPRRLVPGENTLSLTVTNEGGVTTSFDQSFTVAALPPALTVEGLTDGQLIETPTTFRLTNIDSQTPITRTEVRVGDAMLESAPSGEYTIDPAAFRPGVTTVTINLANADSENVIRVPVEIAALPPTIFVDGLSEGDVLTGNRALTFTFDSQTPVIHVAVFVDGVDLAHLVQEPFIVGLEVLRFPPGEHTLRVVADNSGGRSATLDIPFTISPAPAASATATALQATATATAVTATYRAQLTGTAAQATTFAQATAVAAQATAAQSTVFSEATRAQGTLFAQATAVAAQATADRATVIALQTAIQATVNAQQTAAQATVFGQATQAQATSFAQSTATAVEATAAQSTVLAQQTAAQATVNMERTQVQSTAFAQATQAAVSATAAQSTRDTQATAAAAQATALQAAANMERTQDQATAFIQATQDQATVDMQRTEVQATAFTGATQAAVSATAAQNTLQASATRAAAALNASATASQSTIQAQRTAQAATIEAQIRGTSAAQTQTQIVMAARATSTSAQSTLQVQRTAQQATAAAIQSSQLAQQTNTADAAASATSAPLTQTQSSANVRVLATDAQSTIQAQRDTAAALATERAATATNDAQATVSAEQTNTIATIAQATLQALQRAATLTAQFTPSLTASATLTPSDSPTPTLTPSNTATPTQTFTPSLTPTETPDIPASQTADAQATALQATDAAQLTRQAEVASTVSAGTLAALETNAARAQAISRATQDTRATRSAATSTSLSITEAAVTAFAAATQTEVARPTETPTLTLTATETPTPTQTPTNTPDIPASETAESAAAGTASALTATTVAEETAVQAAADQATAAQGTANVRATSDANRDATISARATTNAQATLDMAAAALGTFTTEPTLQPTAAPTEEATAEITPEGGISGDEDVTPTIPPSLTPIGTLTMVEVGTEPPPASDFAPLAVVVVVVMLLLLLVFFLARRRISRN